MPGDATRSERRDEVRDRLLPVIERLLADGEGFAELSVERLVSEAGLARSTFYKYFDDKGDLLGAWFARITSELAGASEPWLGLEESPDREQVRDALAQIVRTYRPHVPLIATVYDAAAYDENVASASEELMGRSAAGLREHIERGQAGGWIDADLHPDMTATWLNWMSERGQHQLIRNADDAEVEKLIDAYTGLVWNTLYAYA